MRAVRKTCLLTAAVLAVGAQIGIAAVAIASVCRAGMVSVRIEEKGERSRVLYVPVPGVLLQAGLAFVPASKWREAGDGIKQWLPLIGAGCSALRESPDGMLVDVRRADEHVSIVKRGGSLIIDVENRGERVRVAVPLFMMAYAVDQLAAHANPDEAHGVEADRSRVPVRSISIAREILPRP